MSESGIAFLKWTFSVIGNRDIPGPVAEGEVLQVALAAAVADRAVEGMVEQQELEHPLAKLCDPGEVWVRTTMPSPAMVAHAGCGFGTFSMLTRHIRQTATGSILGWAQ